MYIYSTFCRLLNTNVKALAVALVPTGRGESEKFRLIRSSFPAEGSSSFTEADIAKSCLGRDRRLVRVRRRFTQPGFRYYGIK